MKFSWVPGWPFTCDAVSLSHWEYTPLMLMAMLKLTLHWARDCWLLCSNIFLDSSLPNPPVQHFFRGMHIAFRGSISIVSQLQGFAAWEVAALCCDDHQSWKSNFSPVVCSVTFLCRIVPCNFQIQNWTAHIAAGLKQCHEQSEHEPIQLQDRACLRMQLVVLRHCQVTLAKDKGGTTSLSAFCQS